MRIGKWLGSFLKDKNKSRRVITILNKTPLRHVAKVILIFLNPLLYFKRRAVVARVRTDKHISQAAGQIRKNGFVTANDFVEPAFLQELYDEATAKMNRTEQISGQQILTNKKFWIRLSDDDYKKMGTTHPFVRFALQEGLLKLLTAYLGQPPYLDYVLLTLSQPSENPYQISQLWHYDRDDVKMAKVFVYLTDVNERADGPFTFFDRQQSKMIRKPLLESHLPDSYISKFISTDQAHEMICPKLSVFIVDTSKCFHMGSRVLPGHHRLMFTANYVTLPAVHPWLTKERQIQIQSDLSPLQNLAVRPTL